MAVNLADATSRTVQVLLIAGPGLDAPAVARCLAPAGHERYELAIAPTLADALTTLADDRPDCVLLDVSLPTGPEGLDVLRAHSSTLPVIALAAPGDDHLGVAALHAGAEDHLVVGELDPAALRRAIRHAITRQRQQRLLAAAHDVLTQETTVREQTEAALARSAADLARSNADLAEFAYVAAHDLRSPLGIISGYAQLLSELPAVVGDADAVDLVQHITAGVDRMESLIDDLLAYCSIGTGPVPSARVDLSLLAATTCGPLVQRAGGGAALELGDLPAVRGDEGQLRQLLDNLTTNAVKFVPPQRAPRVSISAERSGAGWCLTVADNGCGIAETERERVFGMFQRVPGEGDVPGTGIGLAICHRVVEHHGGRIWIEANEPVGTRVRVWLPAD
jgi:signal transduction histidine kinase